MNGSTTGMASPSRSAGDEEKLLLLDDNSLSDIESDAGRAEIESKFPPSSSAGKLLAAAGVCASNNLLRSPPWRTSIMRALLFIVPSFMQPHFLPASAASPSRRTAKVDRLGPTSYLDGMRGVAAFAVFFCHYFYTCFRIADGWGHNNDNYYILKLPLIRLWYQGPPMVCVFFVISGYALSLKPLKLARAAARERRPSAATLPSSSPSSSEAFSTTMSSFVFRRFFRLFLPTVVSTLMIVVLLRLGAYEWTREFSKDPRYMRNVQETHPERLETFELQLRDWGRAMFEFVHVWDWRQFGGSTAYDVHLWTIPVEFRCSMVLFTTLVGVARLRSWVRLSLFVVLSIFCYRSDRWEMLLFYCGAILAELDLIRSAHSDPKTTAVPAPAPEDGRLIDELSRLSPTPETRRRRRAGLIFWWIAGIVALYFMSQPDVGSEATPGWVYLTSLVPEFWTDKYRYWQTIGSVLLVAAVARLPRWQRFFNLAPMQYLGRISYAVYLMHGPVLHTIGYVIERRTWALTTHNGADTSEGGYIAGFALGSVFIVPIVIWAADVFWRAVDAPVVRFARWLESLCSTRE